MTKEEFKYRVEKAKDETPGTSWFINVVVLLFVGIVAWAKVAGV